jgi:hypothetical protein
MSTATEERASLTSTATKAKRKAGKPTVSEAKRAANARNGQLGGPKTPEGKARSRMNGLVHGLRAETLVVLPGESEEKFRRRLEGWFGELAPHGEIERYYAEAAVASSWRRDRCIRAETAILTDRVLDVADPDPEADEAKARRLGARLAKDPAAVAPRLRQTSAGCRWMLAEWDDLDSTLDELGFWEHSRLHLALHLLGYAAPQWRDAGPVTDIVVGAMSARYGQQTTPANVRFALGGKPEAMGKLEYQNETEALATICDDKATGRAELKAIVADARADLLERLEWVEAVEARRQATAVDRASFDDSPAGQRRQRYEAMHDRALRAALRDLRAEQERRMAEGDVAATAPTEPPVEEPPIAPSEPTGAGPIGGSPAVESSCGDRERGCPEQGASGGEAVTGVGETSPDPAVADAPSEPAGATEADAPSEPTASGMLGGNRDYESISDDDGVAVAAGTGPDPRPRDGCGCG